MTWLIIGIAFVAVVGLIYLFYPSIKKLFSKKAKTQKAEKTAKDEIKKSEKKEEQKSKKGVEIIQNHGDLFSEKPAVKEDPDTKVNYENFDLDGLFEENNNENITNLKQDNNEDSVFDDNFEEMFNKYFSDKERKSSIKDKEILRTKPNFVEDDDEIEDLFKENTRSSENIDIKKQFDNLPDEMKALLLSGFLNRKH